MTTTNLKNKLNYENTITITFGDMAENHVGMQQIGTMVGAGQGFNLADLSQIKSTWENLGATCDLVNLQQLNLKTPEAYVLVIRNGLEYIERGMSDAMYIEQSKLDVDKKAFMRGRVVNKKARWNVCFGDNYQAPNYEQKQGTIISFNQVPQLNKFKNVLPKLFGSKAENLYGEGNYYYDTKKCGIGFHGDGERRKVIALRLGQTLDLHYQWFQNSLPIGDRIKIKLNHGDIYVMCEKAVGTDWLKRQIMTLRHATGCDQYTTIK